MYVILGVAGNSVGWICQFYGCLGWIVGSPGCVKKLAVFVAISFSGKYARRYRVYNGIET